MTVGLEVTKAVLDMKIADAVMSVRSALDKVETIASWLVNHPTVDSVDPLTLEPFGYTADEAYAVRLYFESVEGIRTSNPNLSAVGRKMTGLE